jgi:alpha-galactosidase
MAKIVLIGAGSVEFTRSLVRDILTFELLADCTITLVDINREKLNFAKEITEILVKRSGSAAKVQATMDRKKALAGANAVLITILAGGVNVWRHDIEIPKKFGVNFNVGDSRGAAGIFRALRTIPVMLDICRDIEKLCPNAIVLNYTNPMAMLCRAIQKTTDLTFTGLCHSVQGTAEMLARWIDAPVNEIDYVCAGINHMSWYLKYNWKGKDAYPLIRKAIERKEIYNEELVRNEMFKSLGYYITESSGHNSEYNWWFRKRPDLIKKYCIHGTGWNPGEYGYILKEYIRREKTWEKEIKNLIQQAKTMPLAKGSEYASSIINAWLGDCLFEFNGNVPNKGLIENLPKDCCVEVPCVVAKGRLSSLHVGSLPPQLAALNNITVAQEEMAVEAALTGDPELVYHAVCYDPLTASVLSLAEIKEMVKIMLQKNKPYLPQFKSFEF